jgi:hypothetical protein
MTNITSLRAKATELGFSFKKGAGQFAGYVLTNERHDDIDEKPLGSDFSASLADIADFLEDFADDIAAGKVKPSDDDDAEPEVETGANGVPKIKPPSPQKLAAALRGHADASEIKAMMKSANVAIRPTLDIKFEQRALHSREDHKLNWQRKINPDGLHDRNEHDEADDRALREYLKDVERQNKSFLAPEQDAPDFATPKAAVAAQVVMVRRRVSKADLPRKRTLLDLAAAIRDAKDRKDQIEAGRLLNEAKPLVGHGGWSEWLEQIGLSDRTARHWMTQNGKDDTKTLSNNINGL